MVSPEEGLCNSLPVSTAAWPLSAAAVSGRWCSLCPGANPRGEAMSITFPGESADYRAARVRLLDKEIELRRATEAVAAARRALPPGGAVPLVHSFPGPARRRGRARKPAHQPRGGRQVPAVAHRHLRQGARLAAAAAVVLGQQHLQPRLPRRDRRGIAAADAERVPPRWRDDPPLLGLRAVLRADRPRTGPPPRGHARAALEPVRPHPPRTTDQLG